jgi:membrane associated rhomboid family serine protease
MFPIGDEPGPRHSFPIVMVTLLALNILVFFYELSLPQPAREVFFLQAGLIPRELVTGLDQRPFSLVPAWATIFTSMFLHGDLFHIAGNMLFLWIFGDNVEDRLGHVRFLLFYLLCGVLAALAQVAINPGSRLPMVGASGAIAGVLGAYLVLFPHSQIRTLLVLGFFVTVSRVPAIVLIGIWILTQFWTGFASLGVETARSGGVAYWAHIGGFVAGLVLVFVFPKRRRQEELARW